MSRCRRWGRERMNSEGKRREIQWERLPKAITCLIFVFNLKFIVHKSRSDKIVQTNKQTNKQAKFSFRYGSQCAVSWENKVSFAALCNKQRDIDPACKAAALSQRTPPASNSFVKWSESMEPTVLTHTVHCHQAVRLCRLSWVVT